MTSSDFPSAVGCRGPNGGEQPGAQVKHLALVAPFGIKPSEGVIADMYIVTTAEYLRSSVANPDETPEFATLFNAANPQTIEGTRKMRASKPRNSGGSRTCTTRPSGII